MSRILATGAAGLTALFVIYWVLGCKHGANQYELSSVQDPYDIPLYWLVNRDPYNGLLNNPYIAG